MTRRAIVTGAAGFIGAHLCESLVELGIDVVGIDNERSGDWSRLRVDIDRRDEDLTDLSLDDMTALCAGGDVLFHLAAEKYNSSMSTPEKVIDVNVTATDRLLRGAVGAGVGKVVFTSSLYAYGSMGPEPMSESDLPAPMTHYGMSKVAGEHLLRVADRYDDLPWTVARLFFIYGPRQYAEGGYKSVIMANFERMMRGEAPTIFGDGEQALDYVYIDDCIRALLAMMGPETQSMTLNVASGRALSVNELTSTMIDVVGDPTLRPVNGPADWTAGSRRLGEAALIEKAIGWRPEVPFEDGVRMVWEWMTENDG